VPLLRLHTRYAAPERGLLVQLVVDIFTAEGSLLEAGVLAQLRQLLLLELGDEVGQLVRVVSVALRKVSEDVRQLGLLTDQYIEPLEKGYEH
jgi:hypothetical protein